MSKTVLANFKGREVTQLDLLRLSNDLQAEVMHATYHPMALEQLCHQYWAETKEAFGEGLDEVAKLYTEAYKVARALEDMWYEKLPNPFVGMTKKQ